MFSQTTAAAIIVSWLLCATPLCTAREPPLDTYRKLRGPLTTTFTPPSSCAAEVRTTDIGGWPDLQQGCEGPGGGNDCCPPDWARGRYFSPGVCPFGHLACTLSSSAQRVETTINCCPPSFDCADDAGSLCKRYLNTPIALPFPSNEATTTRTARIVYATPIQIRFQKTDSSVVPIPTESFKLPHARKPLSKGAKTGIAIGVIAAVSIGIVAAVHWKTSAKKRNASAAAIPFHGGSDDSAPLQGHMYPRPQDEQAPAPPTYHDATRK
ncbi:hypothetical protein AJ78_05918 [Emergomyces pasteurianus Ep9510]|uniref:Mid2 domain-containing protein n=1 Tax=Emergomyces pasteurianus Ep9510 TaxID=1447872 RepID=A0A1J9QEN0_9EURO|nr:hypothetical protein AJ78_05918 [Emergomyces pasteurianus Ep9510]